MAFEQPHINRARVVGGFIALALVSAIFVGAGCRTTPTDVDPIPERTGLAEVCRVEGKWLRPFGPGNHALVGETAKSALVSDSGGNYWLLHPSDCTLQEVKLPSTTSPESLELIDLTNSGEILLVITAANSRLVDRANASSVNGQDRSESLGFLPPSLPPTAVDHTRTDRCTTRPGPSSVPLTKGLLDLAKTSTSC